jgi:hypothetical protein
LDCIEINISSPYYGERFRDFQEAWIFAYEKTLEFIDNIGYPLKDINNGFCAVFADILTECFCGETEYIEVDQPVPHIFVKYNGRFYDSDHKDGVENFLELSIFLK